MAVNHYVLSPYTGNSNSCLISDDYCVGLNGPGAYCPTAGSSPHPKPGGFSSPLDLITGGVQKNVHLFATPGVKSARIEHTTTCNQQGSCKGTATDHALRITMYGGLNAGGTFIGVFYLGHCTNRIAAGVYNLSYGPVGGGDWISYLLNVGKTGPPCTSASCSTTYHCHLGRGAGSVAVNPQVNCPNYAYEAVTWIYRYLA